MIRLSNIGINRTKIVSSISGNKEETINKKDMSKIILKYGFSEKRPLSMLAVGLTVLGLGTLLGIIPIFKIISHSLSGEIDLGNFGLFAFALPLLILGFWLIKNGLKRGYFFTIITINGIQKIPFKGRVTKDEVSTFIEDCNHLFEYKISDECREHK